MRRIRHPLLWLAMQSALLLIAVVSIQAEESTTSSTPDDATLEAEHEAAREGLFSLVDQIDEFFGNIRSDDQRKDDFFRLGGEMRARTSDSPKFGLRVRAGISLRDIADRLRLVIEGDQNSDPQERLSDSEGDVQNSFATGSSEERTFRTGLRYALLEVAPVQLDFDGGIRFSGGPNPYSQIRASRYFPLNDVWSFEPNQYALWELDDGFGERTRLDLNRKLAPDLLFRNRFEALRSESSNGFEMLERISVFRELSKRAFLESYISAFAVTESSFTVEEYRTAARYRQWMFRPWLFVELEPAFSFPDDRDHEITPEIVIRVDVYFDRTPERSLLQRSLRHE